MERGVLREQVKCEDRTGAAARREEGRSLKFCVLTLMQVVPPAAVNTWIWGGVQVKTRGERFYRPTSIHRGISNIFPLLVSITVVLHSSSLFYISGPVSTHWVSPRWSVPPGSFFLIAVLICGTLGNFLPVNATQIVQDVMWALYCFPELCSYSLAPARLLTGSKINTWSDRRNKIWFWFCFWFLFKALGGTNQTAVGCPCQEMLLIQCI